MDTAAARPAGGRAVENDFGCQMNVYDAQRMADVLAPEGYVETATPTRPISSF